MITGPSKTFFESGLLGGVNDKRKLDNERGSGVRRGMMGDESGRGGESVTFCVRISGWSWCVDENLSDRSVSDGDADHGCQGSGLGDRFWASNDT